MRSEKNTAILKDILGVITFVVLVFLGVILINSFIFRSFNVQGPSMEETLFSGDKLIVNKIPVTISNLSGKKYEPKRGDIIVFKNPEYSTNFLNKDEFIVKRVIGLPGERVVVFDGKIIVYNKEKPEGFDPDSLTDDREGSPTSGDVDIQVPKDEIFVAGDHRQANYSLDSRSGLGTIPFEDIVGPVGIRIFPFQNIRSF